MSKSHIRRKDMFYKNFINKYENPKLPEGIEETNFNSFLDENVKTWSDIAFL